MTQAELSRIIIIFNNNFKNHVVFQESSFLNPIAATSLILFNYSKANSQWYEIII